MKNKSSFYDNRIVSKPWGYEYVVYRNANHLSVTLLSINYNKMTSLHCHPLKKSGFILLKGKASFQLGLRKKNTELHSSPSKRMMARGLFHSIKSVSKNGLLALEFETPVNKNANISLEVHKNFIKLLKNKNSTFFAVLDGSVSDNKGRNVLSYGDIIKTDDLRILSKVFKIKKKLSVVKVYKT